MTVDPDDRHRRPEPQPFVQRRRRITDKLDTRPHAHRVRECAELVVEAFDRRALGRRWVPQAVVRARERRVAVLVDK